MDEGDDGYVPQISQMDYSLLSSAPYFEQGSMDPGAGGYPMQGQMYGVPPQQQFSNSAMPATAGFMSQPDGAYRTQPSAMNPPNQISSPPKGGRQGGGKAANAAKPKSQSRRGKKDKAAESNEMGENFGKKLLRYICDALCQRLS